MGISTYKQLRKYVEENPFTIIAFLCILRLFAEY